MTAEGSEGSTLIAELRQTYFPREPSPTDVEPDHAVRIVIASSNAGPCGVRADVDQLTIALSDGTRFVFPLQDPIDASCGFTSDIGVQ